MLSYENIVTLKDLFFFRENKVILSNLNIKIKKGSITCIVGPSGAGKTTLLKIICGQVKPNSGSVHIFNKKIDNISAYYLNKLRKNIGMLFQSGALFNNINVFENIAFPIREHTNLDENMIEDLVSIKLHAVNLMSTKSLMPAQLSGGMRRRVAFARTIALDPKLTLFDEPFAGQDPINKKILLNLIKSFNSSFKSTSIIVTHDIKTALLISNYIYIISEGKVVCEGAPDYLKKLKNEYAKQIINGSEEGPLSFQYNNINNNGNSVFNI